MRGILDPLEKVRQADGDALKYDNDDKLWGAPLQGETCMDFTGTWDVVSSPHFDEEYLKLDGPPYVTLHQKGDFVKGEYSIGVMAGTINGGAHSDFIDFDFWGNDEMEEAFGEGQGTLEGERLIFELWQYHGDEWTFECERRR
jgi:hypothetical protein